jgi:hypothetical protein
MYLLMGKPLEVPDTLDAFIREVNDGDSKRGCKAENEADL